MSCIFSTPHVCVCYKTENILVLHNKISLIHLHQTFIVTNDIKILLQKSKYVKLWSSDAL